MVIQVDIVSTDAERRCPHQVGFYSLRDERAQRKLGAQASPVGRPISAAASAMESGAHGKTPAARLHQAYCREPYDR